MRFSRKQIVAGSAALILLTAACAISSIFEGGLSEAEQTLQAYYKKDTA